MKKTIIKIISIIFLVFGLFIFFVGIGMAFDSNEKESQDGLPIAVFSMSFLITGGLGLYWSQNIQKKDFEMDYVISVVKSYRRISIPKVSELTGIASTRLRKILSRAVMLNKIQGYYDRGTDEFFTTESTKQKAKFKFCPSCGAPYDQIYYEGKTLKCDHCGFTV